MLSQILKELRSHAPFTACGAITAIFVVMFFRSWPFETSYNIFYVLHPLHVLLSALVTASIYEFHSRRRTGGKCSIWALLAIGYVGSVGIATLSDSLIPYLGELLLNLPNREVHLGFIEKWWLVNPLAFLGIAIAWLRPVTKFPHSAHVLLSTWASLFHVIMAAGKGLNWFSFLIILFFLFLAVWLPCCVSDIVFPLLFVKRSQVS